MAVVGCTKPIPSASKAKNDQPRVHIFWDDSNIFLEGRRYAEKTKVRPSHPALDSTVKTCSTLLQLVESLRPGFV